MKIIDLRVLLCFHLFCYFFEASLLGIKRLDFLLQVYDLLVEVIYFLKFYFQQLILSGDRLISKLDFFHFFAQFNFCFMSRFIGIMKLFDSIFQIFFLGKHLIQSFLLLNHESIEFDVGTLQGAIGFRKFMFELSNFLVLNSIHFVISYHISLDLLVL